MARTARSPMRMRLLSFRGAVASTSVSTERAKEGLQGGGGTSRSSKHLTGMARCTRGNARRRRRRVVQCCTAMRGAAPPLRPPVVCLQQHCQLALRQHLPQLCLQVAVLSQLEGWGEGQKRWVAGALPRGGVDGRQQMGASCWKAHPTWLFRLRTYATSQRTVATASGQGSVPSRGGTPAAAPLPSPRPRAWPASGAALSPWRAR